MSRRALSVLVAIAAALALHPAAAAADKEIQGQPSNRFVPADIAMDGERLTFRNQDLARHNVTSQQSGPDGKALFSTPLLGTGESAFVEGSQYLTTGAYPYLCSVHPFMTGTISVSSAGTPVPRPGGVAGDATAPKASVKIRKQSPERVLDSGKVVVDVKLDEAAKVDLSATTKTDGKRITVAKASKSLKTGTSKVSLVVTKAGRKAVDEDEALTLSLSARAKDPAGNKRTIKTSRTLRP